EGHLLGKCPDLLAVGVQRFCGKRMARSAQLGAANVIAARRLEALGRGAHDHSQTGIDVEGPVFRMRAIAEGAVDRESSSEACRSAQIVRGNLMTHGAG